MLSKSKYLLLIISLIFIVIPSVSYAAENIIKVGFPRVEGFSEIKDGECSGYAYEYLREISRFTGWQYDFIEIDSSEMIAMLRAGEIDLVGGILKNPASEKIFDFPEYDCGVTYTTITTLKSNSEISETDYKTFEGIRVGVYETATSRIKSFQDFCKANGIQDVEIVEYALVSDDILHEALKKGEVDAILAGDLLVNSDERIVAKFATTPYYFATNKGNIEIIQGLNYAIGKIREITPDFSTVLYNKYFSQKEEYKLFFTEEERAFIENLDQLKAVYIDDYAPIQNYSPRNRRVEGIAIDVVNLLAQYLGIEIELIRAKTYEEALEMMKNQKADILATMANQYKQADEYHIALTKSYICLPMVRIENKLATLKEDKVLAIPKGRQANRDTSKDSVLYMDNLASCIEAVNSGKADYTYGDIYSVESYTRERYYKNISIIYTSEILTELCIGVRKPIDVTLLSIINKVVQSISKKQMEEIVYQNLLFSKAKIDMAALIYSNYRVIIGILGGASISIFIIMRMRLKYTSNINKTLKEKAERDALTGVYNSGMCESLITEYISNKSKEVYGAFFIMDVDYFKNVNDYLGHKIGDDVLREWAADLSQLFSSDDIVARWGGDEFVVFMKDLKDEDLEVVTTKATQLCQTMDKTVQANGKTQHISVSVGIIIFKDSRNFLEVYQLADKNLYQVKETGKNGFKIEVLD